MAWQIALSKFPIANVPLNSWDKGPPAIGQISDILNLQQTVALEGYLDRAKIG